MIIAMIIFFFNLQENDTYNHNSYCNGYLETLIDAMKRKVNEVVMALKVMDKENHNAHKLEENHNQVLTSKKFKK